jgi:protein SCO1/2
MKSFLSSRFFAMALALFFVLFFLSTRSHAQSFISPGPGKSALSRNDLVNIGIEQRLGNQIPGALNFTDSTGQVVDFDALLNRKPTLLALVYYDCPNLCTLVLNGMISSVADLRRTVGNGFQIVVVSIDPTETPKLAAQKKTLYLKRYSRGQNQDQEWSFLIGDKKNIQQLANAVGYHYKYDRANHQYAHGSGIMMLDTHGRLVKYFLGIEYSPAELEKAIQLAQENQIGSPVQQFLLLCYCYNPLTGPYGFLISTILKVTALLTVLALAGFILFQVRREFRGKAPL